jgi:hypothetical protein
MKKLLFSFALALGVVSSAFAINNDSINTFSDDIVFGSINQGDIVAERAVAAAASFDPSDLNPTVWIDTTLSNMTVATNLVSQIDDMSGNDNHFKASGATRPADNTHTINGKTALGFDGTDDYMATDAEMTFAGDFTMVVVLQQDTTGTDGFAGRESTTTDFVYFQSSQYKYKFGNGSIISTGLNRVTSQDTCITLRRSGSDVYADLDGSEVTENSYNGGTLTIDNLADAGGATPSWDGAISFFILIPSFVTGDDLTNLYSYINDIWGVCS